MGLDTQQRQAVTYFTGNEVEHTIAHGMFTLFVVGTPPLSDILYKAMRHKVKHIYFGTSQSYDSAGIDTWDDRIRGCLDKGYFVTLDFDVKYTEDILEMGWCEYNRFIPMVSVKMPYIEQFNYNTTIKIDDTTWGATNPGVWTHQLHDLQDKSKFTHWDQYTGDSVIRAEENKDEKFLTLT